MEPTQTPSQVTRFQTEEEYNKMVEAVTVNERDPKLREQKLKVLELKKPVSMLSSQEFGQQVRDRQANEAFELNKKALQERQAAAEQPKSPLQSAETPESPSEPKQGDLTDSDSNAPAAPQTPATTTPTAPISPEVEKTTVEKIKDTNIKIGEAETKGQKDILTAKEKRDEQIQEADAKYLESVSKLDAEIEQSQARTSQLTEDYSNMKYVDFWEKKSTGEKILGAISIALGAIAQARSEGKIPNTALNIINGAVAEDKQAFKDKLQKQLKLIDMSKLNTKEKKVKKIELLEQYEGKIDSYNRQLNNTLDTIGTRTGINVAPLKVELENNLIDLNREDKEATKTAKEAEFRQNLTKEQGERYVPGYGIAIDKDSAKTMRGKVAEGQKVIQGIERLEKLGKEYELADFEDKKLIQQEIQVLVGQLRLPLLGPGTMTDKEYDRLVEVIGDPSKFFSIKSHEMAKLKNLKATIRNNLETDAQTYILPSSRKQYQQSGQQYSETKIVNGFVYGKVAGGWKKIGKAQ